MSAKDEQGAKPRLLLWNSEKDEWLRRERRIGFEDVRSALKEGKLLADLPHPNQARFPAQRVLIVDIRNETYVVPYVADEHAMFLKTIYASRKARRIYGRGERAAGQVNEP